MRPRGRPPSGVVTRDDKSRQQRLASWRVTVDPGEQLTLLRALKPGQVAIQPTADSRPGDGGLVPGDITENVPHGPGEFKRGYPGRLGGRDHT